VGDPLPEDLTSFRREFRETVRSAQSTAERRLGASLARKCRSHTTCWDVLRKLRQPSRAVAIDSETLFQHFSSIFFDPNEPLIFDPESLGIFPPDGFELTLFTDEELLNALSALNSQAAVGPQRVASRYLKSVFSDPRARVVLLALMNMCFWQGKVPKRWGESEVFVLYKGKGEVTDPINYRGINLNDDFLRIYERLLDARMMVWLREYKPWGYQQFGFSEGVGTEDAYLCLETLASICTNFHRIPLYANFIDLQRAFPSMLRSRALQVLNEAGLPYELTRAFASTFSSNYCSLKINNKLTRVFFVNRGTKEGGINSPRIFNTVYSQILKRLAISPFPSDPLDFDPHAVYYLIFADDLVLLSGDLSMLERLTNELDAALDDVGMKINSGKCKWMAYLPKTPNFQSIIVPQSFTINHAGTMIDNVEEFKYLGFLSSYDLSHKHHIKARVVLLTLAARMTGRLLRSLQLTNFRSLRSYYQSLVSSQLYSLSMINFPELELDRSVKIFLQECFNLPPSFPMSISKLFLRIDDLILQAFTARSNFFQRVLRGDNSHASLAAMSMDRGVLMSLSVGWNSDFQNLVSDYLDFSEIDLSSVSAIEEARSELREALANRRLDRFSSSASDFVIQLCPNLSLPPNFLDHLATLPHESVRIILIFFANMFQFTYFRALNLICPFCHLNLSSTHFFTCQGASSNSVCDWSLFTQEFQLEEYAMATDRLFLVLQRWTIVTNRFQPSLSAHLNEYFEVTDFQQRSQNLALGCPASQ
jgi:hypothetical protein